MTGNSSIEPGLAGLRIDPDRLYTEEELRIHGLFDEDRLARMRRGGLKSRELSKGRRVYMGRWLLDWLEGKPE